MIQLNLLPDVKQQFLKTQRTKRTIITAAVVVAVGFISLVVLLGANVYMFQRNHMDNLSTDIKENINELQSIQDLNKILTIQGQLDALPDLHAEEPVTSRLFTYLRVITPGDISLTNVEVSFGTSESPDTTIKLSGRTKDFKAANKFVDTIKNATYNFEASGFTADTLPNAFSAVVLASLSKADDAEVGLSTSFSIEFEFDEAIFDQANKKIVMTVPKISSSVSSKERPLFVEEGDIKIEEVPNGENQ